MGEDLIVNAHPANGEHKKHDGHNLEIPENVNNKFKGVVAGYHNSKVVCWKLREF